jgi:hypothetical protein
MPLKCSIYDANTDTVALSGDEVAEFRDLYRPPLYGALSEVFVAPRSIVGG